jgi:hypothetical protein
LTKWLPTIEIDSGTPAALPGVRPNSTQIARAHAIAANTGSRRRKR